MAAVVSLIAENRMSLFGKRHVPFRGMAYAIFQKGRCHFAVSCGGSVKQAADVLIDALAQVLVGQLGDLAATGRALEEALLDEEGLVHLFQRAGVLADGCGDGAEAYGSATKLVDDGAEDLVVNLVEAVAVDVECFEGIACYLHVDGAGALDLCEVAHAAQQGVGDTGGATAAAGNLGGRLMVARHAEDVGRAGDDAGEDVGVVVLEVHVDAEAGAERCGEHAAARGGADEREGVEVDLYAACRGSLVDHDVDAVVLHGGVQVFLDDG